jgi:hypothetical protein
MLFLVHCRGPALELFLTVSLLEANRAVEIELRGPKEAAATWM